MKLQTIKNAASLIRDSVIRTPIVHSPTLSRMFDCEVFLKLENLQKTGSFKIRGAMNKVMTHAGDIRADGVVTASAGNHAQGVAFAAKAAGIPSTIVMPEWASITKQQATIGYGGELIIHGANMQESLVRARELSGKGPMFIHPFDDEEIIAGQGTIALEIMEDLPDVDLILVPIGGGGLISGISAGMKALSPKAKIVGVQTEVCPSAFESRKEKKVVRVNSTLSIADGISVKQVGELPFIYMEKYVDDIVLVEEEQIAAAILMLLERKKVLSEGAGAVPLAALLNKSVKVGKGSRVLLVISGGNVDGPLLGRIINKGLVKNGRIISITVQLEDRPGSLSRLLGVVAMLKANILHIYHDRNVKHGSVNISYVELELETRSFAHINEVHMELENAGYKIELGPDR